MPRTALAMLIAAAILAACTSETDESRPPIAITPPPAAPQGRLVRIDDVSIDADQTVLTVSFVGAPELEPTSPCAKEYFAESELQGDVVELAVTEIDSRFARLLRPNEGCDLIGFRRELHLPLGAPFFGSTIHDRAGYTFFIAPPPGLAELPGLPDGWSLLLGEDVPESASGRWLRAWSETNSLPRQSWPGRLDLIQAFGAHAAVSGSTVQPPVKINGGTFAQLWTSPETGEIVLAWSLDGDGLALVANEADFSVEQLVDLAESASLPD